MLGHAVFDDRGPFVRYLTNQTQHFTSDEVRVGWPDKFPEEAAMSHHYSFQSDAISAGELEMLHSTLQKWCVRNTSTLKTLALRKRLWS
jgi:hypothetical protein